VASTAPQDGAKRFPVSSSLRALHLELFEQPETPGSNPSAGLIEKVGFAC
jgi:hypothetical protein